MFETLKEWFRIFREQFRLRLRVQGMRIDRRYENRPRAKRIYTNIMLIIGALIITYLVLSLMCVIYVIGRA